MIYEATQASLQRVIARGCWSATEQLGGSEGWRAERVVEGADATEFMLTHGAQPIGVCTLPLAGAHNRANAIAAVVAAAHVGVDFATSLAALSRFGGVKRRLEVRGRERGVTVYDDFAHHPTAIETTIAGLRSRMEAARLTQGDAGFRQRPGRLLAVVEPRSNTMKLGAMKALLADSLEGADLVFCHGAGLGWDAAQVLAPLGLRARTFDDIDAMVQAIAQEARDGDQVLVMSNGGFGGIHGKLLAALAAGSPSRPRSAGAGWRSCRQGCRHRRRRRDKLRLRPSHHYRKDAHRALMRLIYLHGFRSSSRSFKARLLQARLAAAGCADRFRRARPAGGARPRHRPGTTGSRVRPRPTRWSAVRWAAAMPPGSRSRPAARRCC